ncbi:unnamed protein product, partial [Brugia timori]
MLNKFYNLIFFFPIKFIFDLWNSPKLMLNFLDCTKIMLFFKRIYQKLLFFF